MCNYKKKKEEKKKTALKNADFIIRSKTEEKKSHYNFMSMQFKIGMKGHSRVTIVTIILFN